MQLFVQRISQLSVMTVMLGLAASCGSGGSSVGGSSNAPAPITPPPVQPPTQPGSILGERVMPGYQVSVSSSTPMQASAQKIITVLVTPEGSQPPATNVAMAVSIAEPSVWVTGNKDTDVAHQWSALITLPGSLTGARVWVRVADSDGNVSQSGLSDYPLP